MPEGFHAVFAEALADPDAALAAWLDPADAGRLSVYRNTVAKGCADALLAQFPTVEAVVGEAWLRAAAGRFARARPPSTATLADYGADFPAWLADFPPAAGLPFLPDLARIDRARTEALFAADLAPLDAAAVAALTPKDYAARGLALHPATRLLAFATSTPALWAALQSGPAEAMLAPDPQSILIVRPHLEVGWRVLGPGAGAFVTACAQGRSLEDAGGFALAAEPGLELGPVFADLIGAGAFARLTYPNDETRRIYSAS